MIKTIINIREKTKNNDSINFEVSYNPNDKKYLYCFEYIYTIKLSKNKEKTTRSTLFSIYLKNYHQNLAEALFNYYKNIIKEILLHKEDIFALNNNSYFLFHNGYNKTRFIPIVGSDPLKKFETIDENNIVNQFVLKNTHKKYTHEMAVEFLLYYTKYDKYSINDTHIIKEVKTLAEQHAKQYPVDKKYYSTTGDFDNMIKYLSPSLVDFDKNSIRFLTFSHHINNYNNHTNDKENIELFCKFFTIAYNAELGNKNIDINKKFKVYENNTCDFPTFFESTYKDVVKYNYYWTAYDTFRRTEKIKQEKIIDFVQNLTIAEFLKIVNFINEYSLDKYKDPISFLTILNIDFLLELSTIIIDGENSLILDNNITKNFVKKYNKHIITKDRSNYIEKQKYNPIIGNIPIIKLFIDYISSKEIVTQQNLDKVKMINESIFDENIDDMLGFIVLKLQKIMNNDEIIDLLCDSIQTDKRLSYDNWIDYISSYDDNKLLPFSWWLELQDFDLDNID